MVGRGGCSGRLCGRRDDGRMRSRAGNPEAHLLRAREGPADGMAGGA